jgi:phosphoglycerate dehydrogenase-like enzyme
VELANSARSVFIGPTKPAMMVDAIAAGGGKVVDDPGVAEAIVWLGRPSDEVRSLLHDGITWLQLPSAGVENWISAGVVDGSRTVTSAVGSYGPQVAEHALALILASLRRLVACARATTWAPATVRGSSLRDACVAIVGAGEIGRELITMLGPLGARTVAVTRRGLPVPGADESLPTGRLAEALRAADVVVLAAPVTPATTHLMNAATLAHLRPGAHLVNVGRGELVDTDALLAALDGGQLAGAALDVTEPEPLPDGHPLWTHPLALITPHTANPESLRLASLARRLTENTRRFVAGEPLVAVVDPEIGY